MLSFQLFSLLLLGYQLFIVLFVRIGFFFNIPISNYSLPLSLLVYLSLTTWILTFIKFNKISLIKGITIVFCFCILHIVFYLSTFLFARSYDLSWDGQGYQQTAIIALSQGWNPVFQPKISLLQELESQIFAESYPSALWEIQSTIYSYTGVINTAKVTNLIIGVVAYCYLFILFRRFKLNKIISFLVSFLIVVQPVYLNQFLTFMQDGYGYQLIIISLVSLLLTVTDSKVWTIISFSFAILLMIGTKYSFLPISLVLSIFFTLVFVNKILNKIINIDRRLLLVVISLFICGSITMYIPYFRNYVSHGHAFYPTNIPDLIGSVSFNNKPNNLSHSGKLSLLLHGILSRSQTYDSGDPINAENVAFLKVPFSFSMQEIRDASHLYNNRVGAGGPLFSGIVTLVSLILLIMMFKTTNQKERYTIYSVNILLTFILILTYLSPTPNLLRYNSYLQLIPFVVIMPLYIVFRYKYIKALTSVVLLLLFINSTLVGYGVVNETTTEYSKVTKQFEQLKRQNIKFNVRAQHFYSNYVLLTEKNVPFNIVTRLTCGINVKDLVSSSNTTHYCLPE